MEDRDPTLQDIARKANVSIGTVDRSIHNRGRVSQTTKEKVLRIAQELGYRKNIYASLLAKQNSTIQLAYLLPEKGADPYWDMIIEGIHQANEERPSKNIVFKRYSFDLFDPKDFLEVVQELEQEQFDILLTAPIFDKEWLQLENILHKRNIPYVIINTLPEKLDPNYVSFIGPDAYQSGQLAGRLMYNHTKDGDQVVMIPLEKDYHNARHMLKKEEGFKDFFQKNNSGVEVITLPLDMFNEYQYLKSILTDFLLNHPRIQGIYTSASRVHILASILKELQTNLILIGYDALPENIAFLKEGYINYLINQNPTMMGYLGMKTIQNYIVHKSEIRELIFMPLDIILPENYYYYQNNIHSLNSPLSQTTFQY